MPANAGYIIDVPGDGPEVYISQTMQISGPQLTELTEVIEDTIEYFCDKEQVSGQLTWFRMLNVWSGLITENKSGILLALWWILSLSRTTITTY